MKRQIREELGEKLSIPPEVMGSLPLTQVHGRRNVSIENHGGILAYTDTCVRVAVRGGAVSVQCNHRRIFLPFQGLIQKSKTEKGLLFRNNMIK